MTMFDSPGAKNDSSKLDGSKFIDVDSEDNVRYRTTVAYAIASLRALWRQQCALRH